MIFDHRNANRDKIMKLIEEQPGFTLYDIKRTLNLNVGTVRYHLLILSLNQNLTSFDDGSKYVRYFKNSNTFTDDQKMVISMLRRSHVKEILKAIIASPGIQNIDLATELGLHEGTVSRCMRMLTTRGIVVKASANGDKAVYKIVEKYKPLVMSCLKIVDAGVATIEMATTPSLDDQVEN